MSDLNDLLDLTLDDLADLPSFKPFNPGGFRVLASFESKEINGDTAIELGFKMLEVIEMSDANDAQPAEGDTASTMCFLKSEYGQGELKRLAAPFAEALELTTIRDVIEQVKDVECILVSTLRKDKNDPDKVYLKVKELQVT